MVHLHAVGRREHAAAGGHDAAKLADRASRVVRVLERLRAEHQVEASIAHGNVLDGPFELRRRICDVDTDVLRDCVAKERLVRFRPASHVE